MNRVSTHAMGGGTLPPQATLADLLDRRTMPYGIALLRLVIGGLFISHLYGKFAFFGIDNWWTGLERAGYPAWVLVYTLSAEFAGAVLITLGVYTRWASLYALPMMIGATLFWVQRKGFYFTGAGWELPFIWSLMLLVQALLGDGAFALASPLRLRLR
ncbi:MAG TPA: DoxX family protein [Stellaceae bacterium]